jgi:hypothetical protein
MSTNSAALSGRLQQALVDIERVVARAEALLEKANLSQDDGYFDGIALNLHTFYTGVEAIFEDIARTLDGAIPGGPNWHQELLQQMAAAITGVRPPVIQTETRYCLDEYRGFRHLVRNLYTFNLRPSRISELCSELRACYDAVDRDISEFIRMMDNLNEPSNSGDRL